MSMCSYAHAGRADEHVLMSSYEHVLIRSLHKIAPDMILKIEQNLYVIVRIETGLNAMQNAKYDAKCRCMSKIRSQCEDAWAKCDVKVIFRRHWSILTV